MKALAFAPRDERTTAALERGLDRLASPVGEDGALTLSAAELPYPVYTAALAALALRGETLPARERAREAWLALLREHQLDEELGWSPADPGYGGWGYAATPPLRSDRTRTFEADLSSTLFALGALRACGAGPDDPAVERARLFVLRCQNLPLSGETPDPARDDGGFFMTPCNAFQNKTGGDEPAAGERRRACSYGSMTADGARALLRAGFAHDHAAVRAARGWLERRFDASRNPGDFERAREVERDGALYYWCWSAAHALTELGAHDLDWAAPLAEHVLSLQRPDGSWSNPATLLKEDDPLVATPLALAGLALARLAIPPPP